MALLTLLHELSAQSGMWLAAVTVDHGLRPEAADEAAAVAAYCARLGIGHETLHWKGWDGTGNVQKAARDARYGLMTTWAKQQNIDAIALGHTQDDQAETVVMRLARGSGVDGLSAMAPARHSAGILWVRPMLGLRRAALRDFLRERNVAWHDDLSNEDCRFERVKARRALEHLEPLGISAAVLAQVAGHMQNAQQALERETCRVAQTISTPRAGGVDIDFAAFESLPDDIARRLIQSAMSWITGKEYGPRGKSLMAVLRRLPNEKSATLDGCRFILRKNKLWILREYHAVIGKKAPIDTPWDGRWQVFGPKSTGPFHVAALGPEGLKHCPGWRDSGLPRDLLLASPAVWHGATFCAAPLAGRAEGWRAELVTGDATFFRTPISH